MKKYLLFIIAIFSLAVFSACSGNETVDNYTKTFEGKIGEEYEIVAKLKFSNNQLEGVYYYKKLGVDLKIKGSIDADGILILNEFDSNGNQTGIFKGTFSNTSLSGNWSKPDGSKSKAFSLKESEINYDSTRKSIIEKNQGSNKVGLPPSNFSGKWSNEGDISEDSRMEIEINQSADKIDGTIRYSRWDENGNTIESTGDYAITGSIIGDTAKVKLFSYNGKIELEAKFIRVGENLKFIQNPNPNSYFPNQKLVWKFDF